jgi:hypothetical protein
MRRPLPRPSRAVLLPAGASSRRLRRHPALLLRFLPLIQELGGARDSNARQLLYALRPYLKPERQEKVERALQLARLFHLGRKFLAGWEG